MDGKKSVQEHAAIHKAIKTELGLFFILHLQTSALNMGYYYKPYCWQ